MLSFHRDPNPVGECLRDFDRICRGSSRARLTGVVQCGETCAKAHTRSSVVDRVCACNVTAGYGVGVGVGVAVSPGVGVGSGVGSTITLPAAFALGNTPE
jgi:hypothetical protein